MTRWLLLMLLLPNLALATEPAARRSVRFSYQREPPTLPCPSAAEMRALVGARLGYEPFSEDAPLTATVSFREAAGELAGSLVITDIWGAPVGSRRLTSATGDCAPLAESLALALAIAVDPDVLSRPAPPPPTASPQVPAVDLPPAPSVSPPEPRRTTPVLEPEAPPSQQRPQRSWLVWVGGGLGAGQLPAPAGSLVLAGELRFSRVGVAVETEFLFSPPAQLGGGQVDSSLYRGGVRLQGRFGHVAFGVRFLAGVFQAQGRDFVGARSGSSLHAALGPVVTAELGVVSGLRVGLSGGMDILLVPQALAISTTELWRSAPAAFFASLSVGWRFGPEP